jgi:hypothetical protein
MKTNAKLMLFLTIFYLVDAIAYGVWSSMSMAKGMEPIGTAAIAMLAALAGFIYFYIAKTAKHTGSLPEDLEDANIEDGDAEVGFFAPWSWWPLAIGFFASIVFASMAIGWWLTFVSVPLALVALIGLVFEFSRGRFAH